MLVNTRDLCSKGLPEALGLLGVLCGGSEAAWSSAVQLGIMDMVVGLLNGAGSTAATEKACILVANMSSHSAANQRAVRERGGIDALVKVRA